GVQNEEKCCFKLPLSTGPRPVNRGKSEATPHGLRLPPGKSFGVQPLGTTRVKCQKLTQDPGVRPTGPVCSQHMSELERTLLRRLRDRDERAFRELIEDHRDRVFNITYRMLGNRAEAEDVAQEVFISVFKTIET